ncbi:MAG: hypothetical protein ACJAT4_002506 [Granulosicoccus sp.]|jgi:hypothetical protein
MFYFFIKVVDFLEMESDECHICFKQNEIGKVDLGFYKKSLAT